MKKLISILFFVIFGCSVWGQGYWEELVAPPGGAPVLIRQATNGTLFLAVFNHLGELKRFSSTNNGIFWEEFSVPQPVLSLYDENISYGRTGNLYSVVVTDTSRIVYRSIDNGNIWTNWKQTNELISDVEEDEDGNLYFLKYSQFGFEIIEKEVNGIVDTITSAYTGGVGSIDINNLNQIVFNYASNVFKISTDNGNSFRSLDIASSEFYFATHQNTLIGSVGSKIIRLVSS